MTEPNTVEVLLFNFQGNFNITSNDSTVETKIESLIPIKKAKHKQPAYFIVNRTKTKLKVLLN